MVAEAGVLRPLDPLATILDSSRFHLLFALFSRSLFSKVSGFACGMPCSCLCFGIVYSLLFRKSLIECDKHGSQSHEAAFESYADASQSLPFRGSVEILPSTTQFKCALRENDRFVEIDSWLLIFRSICKRESWAQHASTQPPGSGFKFVAES